MRSPSSPQVTSFAAAETARRVAEECIRELQTGRPSVLRSIVLEDGIETAVAHKLGRAPLWVGVSCVRGAVASGRVEEVRTGSYQFAQVIVLRATGYGGPVTIDLAVL